MVYSLVCVLRVVVFSPWSLGSFGYALGFSGSSAVAGFIRVNAGDRQIYPGKLNILGFAMGDVGFIRNRCVHSSAPWGWSRSSGVRCGVRRVHPVCLDTWVCALRHVHFCWVHWGVGFVRVRS